MRSPVNRSEIVRGRILAIRAVLGEPCAVPTYAVGDVQGCLTSLSRLLDSIGLDPSVDRLLFCGDLVNRGPDSLGVLRLVRDIEGALVSVLGNHDLHLLARAEGLRPAGKQDTMDDVLSAPDREELLDWLASRPFSHLEEIEVDVGAWISNRRRPGAARQASSAMAPRKRRFFLVHAGLLPEWSIEEAMSLATEATMALRADRRAFLETIYAKPPPRRWKSDLSRADRLRAIVAALVRIRMLDEKGEMDDDFTGPPPEGPPGHRPWFDARPRQNAGGTVVLCGHWAALGLVIRDDFIGLDTGCVWGKELTAVRLEDLRVFQVPAGE